jgi:protein-disulfide isomerase
MKNEKGVGMKGGITRGAIALMALLAGLGAGVAGAESPTFNKEALRKVVAAQLGQKNAVITAVEDLQPSPIPQMGMTRVWIKGPDGEYPNLFYVSQDGQYFILGTYTFTAWGGSIGQQLAGRPKPRMVDEKALALDERYRIGKKDAPVRIVGFSDIDCPYCKVADETIQKIYEANKDKVAVYYKFFPLPIHPEAKPKAEVAACFQGEVFFKAVRTLVGVKGKSKEDLRRELNAPAVCDEQAVERDLDLGKRLGIAGTPTFIINGQLVAGAVDKQRIEEISGLTLQ